MEPVKGKVRLRLILGKFPVVSVNKSISGYKIGLQLPNGIQMMIDIPETSDVRQNDLLTLYTEILTHAIPQQPPIQ